MTGSLDLFGNLIGWAESYSSQNAGHEGREGRATDLAASGTSGYGHGHKVEYCPEGIPLEQALFLALAAFAASFGILYRAVTMALGRKRRKRSDDGDEGSAWYEVIQDRLGDILWSGMCVCLCVHTFFCTLPCNTQLLLRFSSLSLYFSPLFAACSMKTPVKNRALTCYHR